MLKDRKEKSVDQPFAVTQYNVLLYMIHMPRSISDGRPLGNSWARIVTNLTPYHTCFNRRSRVALKQREDSQDTSRALPGIINLSLQISTHYCSSQHSTHNSSQNSKYRLMAENQRRNWRSHANKLLKHLYHRFSRQDELPRKITYS